MNIDIEYFSDTNVGLVRKVNEDSHGNALTPLGHVFVLCDGMGGHVGGAIASKMAVECILKYLENEIFESHTMAIANAMSFANTQVFARAQHDPSLSGMGTTCTVAIVTNAGEVYYGHVGDSRIYMFTGGELLRLTRDHSFVQLLVDSGQISEDDAERHPNKNQILRAIGIEESVEPEVAPHPVLPQKGDIFLLCSDGLCGMTTDSAIEQTMKSMEAKEAASSLIELALANGGKDNITITLISFKKTINKNIEKQNYREHETPLKREKRKME